VPVLLSALGAFVVSLDASVNVAFPAMAQAFGVGPIAIRWVIICYVLTYAITSFVAGMLADRLGPAPVFSAGLWVSLASFLAYLTVASFGGVLGLRVLQGIGGGLVYGTAPALVTLAWPREHHGRGLGWMSLGMGAGLAVGPIVGGALVDRFGWSGAFVYRIPVAAGAALVALGLETPRPGQPGPASLPGGVLAELSRGPVLIGLGLVFLANWAQFAVWLLVPFYLSGVLGLSATAAGLCFTLMPLGTAVAGPVGGRLADRVPTRWPMVGGLAVEAIGLALLSRSAAATPLGLVALALALVGLGLGVFQVPNLAQVMQGMSASRQGMAGGLAFMVRTLGIVAGVQATAMLFAAGEAAGGFTAGVERAFAAAAMVCGLAAVLAFVAGARREGGS
jgi:MFS family permease